MIVTLTPSPSRQAKVWLEELPQAIYAGSDCIEHTIATGRQSFATTRQVAAELLIQTGGRGLYGLLGAQIYPKESNNLQLKVFTSDLDGPPFAGTIALPPPSDYVKIGLPKEYASGIVEGVISAKEQLEVLPSGELIFNCAAHGLVGSSPSIFNYLGKIIVNLLTLDIHHFSEQKLSELFVLPLEPKRV